MKAGKQSNALLTELLIVVVFFLLASTMLLQVFAAAREKSTQAERVSAAAAEAQNVADSLYVSEDAERTMTELGFTAGTESRSRDYGDFLLTVFTEREESENGVMLRRTLTATGPGGETLLSLPCSRWMGAGA